MQNPTIYLCAAPAELWKSKPRLTGKAGVIQELLQDVRTTERRLRKELNAEAEAARFADSDEQLQSAVRDVVEVLSSPTRQSFERAIKNNRLPAVRLEDDYFNLLVRAATLRSDSLKQPHLRLAASTYSPDQIQRHTELFEKLARQFNCVRAPGVRARLGALKQFILPNKHGIVELLQLTTTTEHEPLLDLDGRTRPVGPIPKFTKTDAATTRKTKSGDEAMKERLAEWIDEALDTDSTVNASNQSHVITTEVLARYVLANNAKRDREIRVVYGDGSEARPIPLRCLSKTCLATPKEDAVLRLGLISIRHLEMDHAIDFAWFRNRETSAGGTSADTDEYCFQKSLEQLADLRRTYAGRHLTLRMYHTGLEPAVVGFYRAVVTVLRDCEPKRHWLRVIPTYFLGDGRYEEGMHWPARTRA